MGLENLQSIFSEGAGINNSQLGGRHGGTEGSQPPHPDDHSSLDNIVGNQMTPTTKEAGTISEIVPNPLDAFPTPNISKPDLPDYGSSIVKNYNSRFDLTEGTSLPPKPTIDESLTTFNKNQMTQIGVSLGQISPVDTEQTNAGQNNLDTPDMTSGITTRGGLGVSERVTADGVALTMTGPPNTDFNSGQNNQSSDFVPNGNGAGQNNLDDSNTMLNN